MTAAAFGWDVAKEGILLSFEALHELKFYILNAIPLSLLCHMEFFLQVSECDSPSSHHTYNSSSSFMDPV